MITIRDMETEAENGCSAFDAADQLRDYVYGLTGQAFAQAKERPLTNIAEVTQYQDFVREQFRKAIGAGEEKKSPLCASVTGTLHCQGYRIEKIIFQSAPRVWVSANLYLPDTAVPGGQHPAVLLVCGHDPLGKGAAEYQRACICLAAAGIAALCMDSYGQGERPDYYEEEKGRECVGRCTREHDYAGFQCMLLGESSARYLLHDAMRAVDYLTERPDIDSSRIGITGNSGGGTLTVMMMMLDNRIAAAAPGTFVTSRKAILATGKPQDNEQIWPGLTLAGIDHRDCLLCMAPRPVLLLAAAHDFFPAKGTLDTYAWCRKIWKLYGQEARFQLYRDECMHTYSLEMAIRAADFFRTCFQMGEQPAGPGRAFAPAMLRNPRDLWCSAGGYLRNEKAGWGIFEQNRERYLARWAASGKDAQKMRTFLQERLCRNRRPGPLFLRKIRDTEMVLDLFCDSYLWESQEGVINHGFLFRETKDRLPVTIALWRDGCRRLTEHYTVIRDICRRGRAVLVLDITGMGMLEQRQFSPAVDKEAFYSAKFKLNTDLLWLDDCLMALGCFDLLRCLDAVEEMPGTDCSGTELYTWGSHSLYGEIAAFLDHRIRALTCQCPRASFGEIVTQKYYDPADMASFVIPGILKYGDIEDIRKWRFANENNCQ